MNTLRYEIESEINELSPGLSDKLQERKITGIPDGYFDDNEDLLIGLTLLSGEEERRFDDVPEGYFQKIEQKVISQSKVEVRRIQPLFWMVAASMVMLITALVFWPSTNVIPQDEIEMAFLYLEEQSQTLDLDDLVNVGLITEESFSTEAWPEDIPFDSIELTELEDEL